MTKTKSAARVAAMKARMADPAFKAKAKANLEKGQAALAAKRAAKRAPTADPPLGKPDPKPPAPPPTETAEGRRRYGISRWRG